MQPRDRDALGDILARDVLQDPLVRNLEFIEYPQIPWPEMAGIRDGLIHGGACVDLEEVWITLSEQLPSLLALIEPVLSV